MPVMDKFTGETIRRVPVASREVVEWAVSTESQTEVSRFPETVCHAQFAFSAGKRIISGL